MEKYNEMTQVESLNVISEMIEKSRAERIPTFEYDLKYWGFACLTVGALTSVVTRATGCQWWGLLWLLVFVIMFPLIKHRKRGQKRVVTYLDDAINNVFETMLILVSSIVIGFIAWGFIHTQRPQFEYILPLVAFVVSGSVGHALVLVKNKFCGVPQGVSLFFISTLCSVINMEGFENYYLIHLLIGINLGIALMVPGWKYHRRRKR